MTNSDVFALGHFAVLLRHDARGKHRAVAYVSRTLNQVESIYSVTHQETMAVVCSFDPWLYHIAIFTDHAAVTELFKSRTLTRNLARWYLTIQEFNPTFNYLHSRANVVTDSLSKNVPVGVVANQHPVTENFSLDELKVAQRNYDVWSRVIYALESGDEANLPALHLSFR